MTLSPHFGALTPVWVVPLSAPRLTPGEPASPLLRGPRVRSLTRGRGLFGPGPLISALPRGLPRGRPGCDPLRGEPAITGLDWSFAPSPGSWERFARQNPFGPPRGFRPASPCPGLDRPVSGLPPVTTGPLRPRPSRGIEPRYGHVGFPTPTGLTPLGSPRAGTPRPVFLDGRGDPSPRPRTPGLPRFPSGGGLLSGRPSCSRPVSGSFHSPFGVLFSFPSRY